jgi:hypothetical protein
LFGALALLKETAHHEAGKKGMMGMRRLMVLSVTFVVALMLTTSAFAAAKPKAYQGQAGGVQGQVAAKGTAVRGTLPFTGQDLALIAIGGTVLILGGAGFYRLSRNRQ